MQYSLHQSDVLTYLKTLEDNSLDALFCDPPYGLKFMNKKWDYSIPTQEVWREACRVLKPGAYVLVFGGTRTFHRLTCAIEDGGFEIKDCLMYLYGSGFPKSHNISKAIDKRLGAKRKVVGTKRLGGNACLSTKEKGGTYGVAVGTAPSQEVPITAAGSAQAQLWEGYGTQLKPMYEPIILARKPHDGTIADNAIEYGVGGLNIDGCRVGRAENDTAYGWSVTGSKASENKAMTGKNYDRSPVAKPGDTLGGRFPGNVLLDEQAATLLDQQAGNRPSSTNKKPTNGGKIMSGLGVQANGYQVYADGNPYLGEIGGPSRFFYTTKVSSKERNLGCSAPNTHPTMKGIALTTYLAKLILPPGNDTKLLVPYCGTGSEMIGALKAGWSEVIGIELDKAYVTVAKERIKTHCETAAI